MFLPWWEPTDPGPGSGPTRAARNIILVSLKGSGQQREFATEYTIFMCLFVQYISHSPRGDTKDAGAHALAADVSFQTIRCPSVNYTTCRNGFKGPKAFRVVLRFLYKRLYCTDLEQLQLGL